jgi:SagB-type dehydrogenase family enzyme
VSEPERIPTVNVAAAVYGDDMDAADPAELLHEASKLSRSTVVRQMRGVWALEQSAPLRASTTRPVRRNPALANIVLPPGELPPTPLADVLRRRRSLRRFAEAPLALEQLAAVLGAGYGVTGRDEAVELPALRATPSAGALYPLELFVAARRVEGLESGVYHYDPLRHELRRIGDDAEPAAVSPHADVVESAAAVLILAAVFWRSRFKYGLRAYRFTLLEAGHAAQNILLAATALDLGSVVLGGFYDGRIDALLGVDGVNESSLVLVCIGSPPE